MKITGIRTLVVNAAMRNWVFVQIRTDQAGLEGWGEATLEWKTRAVTGAVEDLAPLVVGRDPRDVEQLVRVLTKHSFWRLGVIGMSAISGIEMACYDIFAKSLGVPVWRLLGGRTRDRVPVYTHLGLGEMTAVYESLDEAPLVERAREVVERGYRALKTVFIPYTHYTASPRQIDKVARCMGAIRAAVGEEVEIMVDFHGRCGSASAALQYIEALAPFRPLFVEEPLPPGETLGLVAIKAKTIGADRFRRAAGRPARVRRAVPRPRDRHRPARSLPCRRVRRGQEDRGHGRGRELRGGAAQPARARSPAWRRCISTSRRRNLVIQEEMVGAVPWYDEVVRGPIMMVDGCWQVPEAPGLGIEIDEARGRQAPVRAGGPAHLNAVLSRRHRGGLVMAGRLQDKVAIVTGGGRGIGEATARAMAAEGAKVVIAELDPATGERTAAELGGLFVPCDVREQAQLQRGRGADAGGPSAASTSWSPMPASTCSTSPWRCPRRSGGAASRSTSTASGTPAARCCRPCWPRVRGSIVSDRLLP